MKILMLGWELPPYNSGGLGVACFELCKALALQGVEIDFVVPYQDKHDNIDFMTVTPALSFSIEELRAAGGAYDSQAMISTQRVIAPGGLREQQAAYVKAVQKIIKSRHYDAIHAHDWLTFEAATSARELLNKPLIAHVHATEFDRAGDKRGNPIVHDIEYNTLLLADRIIAVSQATKDIIANKYAIPASKIEVMHNSIDPDSLPSLDNINAYAYLERMKAHGYKVVVTLGRLTVQKGLTHLLKAAHLVVERNPKVLFLIAGAGEQYRELLELSAELGIAKNVLFTGHFVRGKQWRDAYAVGDMFVMPSVSEPFGITALEAVGYGSPVLISKQSGVGEVLSSVLKFDYWDTYRLADQILALAAHNSLGEELRLGGQAEFGRLSWQKVATTCQAIYKRTLKPQESRL